MEPTTVEDFHGRLFRDTFGRDISDEDVFLVFTIFHYYYVELLRVKVFANEMPHAENVCYRMTPQTPRRCAEAIASAWSGLLDLRAEPSYWQCHWQDDWGGYVRVRNLTHVEMARLHQLVEALEKHPFVARLVADGSQPFQSHASLPQDSTSAGVKMVR